MNLTRQAISNPVAVISAILLVLLMGTIALVSLPVQMIPDVQRPYIQINTGWRAAAPEEVESEIIEPQEDMLRGLPGLVKMVSSASRGQASIELSFSVETELQRALIEVINRLNQVPRYPNDVTEPQIFAGHRCARRVRFARNRCRPSTPGDGLPPLPASGIESPGSRTPAEDR